MCPEARMQMRIAADKDPAGPGQRILRQRSFCCWGQDVIFPALDDGDYPTVTIDGATARRLGMAKTPVSGP